MKTALPVLSALIVLAGTTAAAVYPAHILGHALRRRDVHLQPRLRTPAAIVVLGTAQYDGRPSRQLQARLDHALDLARRLDQAQVYTLGGSLPGDRFTEAGVSATYLRDAGVPAGRVTEVAVGSDTDGSVAALVDKHGEAVSTAGTVLVVTDPNHALRAEKITRRYGLDAKAAPTPYCPARFPHKSWWNALAHEVGGMLVHDVYVLAGADFADRVEGVLRTVEGKLRPSRRQRHEHLRQTANTDQNEES